MIKIKAAWVSLVSIISMCVITQVDAASVSVNDVLKPDRMDEFCVADSNGDFVVQKQKLAMALLLHIGFPTHLLQDTYAVIEERAVTLLASGDLPDSEYIGEELETKFHVIRGTVDVYLRAKSSKEFIEEELKNKPVGYFVDLDALYQKQESWLKYKLSKVYFSGEYEVDENGLFKRRVIRIVCDKKLAQTIGSEKKSLVGEFSSALKKIRVRGAVKDLTLTGSLIKSADPAEISFTDNVSENKETVQIDAAVGYPIELDETKGDFVMIPFIEYHNKKTTTRDAPASKVETIGPGVVFKKHLTVGLVQADLSLTPQYVFDEAQGNDIFRGEGFLTPYFNVTEQIQVGRYNILKNGDFWVKPDIMAVGLAGHVTNDGTSPILEKNDDFYGVGGEASLQVFMPNLPVIENLTLGASYRYVQLYSLPIDNAAKWSASAEYSLDESENFTVRLVYEDGRNATTFQDEEFWKVALGIRF